MSSKPGQRDRLIPYKPAEGPGGREKARRRVPSSHFSQSAAPSAVGGPLASCSSRRPFGLAWRGAKQSAAPPALGLCWICMQTRGRLEGGAREQIGRINQCHCESWAPRLPCEQGDEPPNSTLAARPPSLATHRWAPGGARIARLQAGRQGLGKSRSPPPGPALARRDRSAAPDEWRPMIHCERRAGRQVDGLVTLIERFHSALCMPASSPVQAHSDGAGP